MPVMVMSPVPQIVDPYINLFSINKYDTKHVAYLNHPSSPLLDNPKLLTVNVPIQGPTLLYFNHLKLGVFAHMFGKFAVGNNDEILHRTYKVSKVFWF